MRSLLLWGVGSWILLSLPNRASVDPLREASPFAALQNWKRDWAASIPFDRSSTFFVIAHPSVWTAERYQAASPRKLNGRLRQLSFQMLHGFFRDVFLVQTVDHPRGEKPVFVPTLPKEQFRIFDEPITVFSLSNGILKMLFEVELWNHATVERQVGAAETILQLPQI